MLIIGFFLVGALTLVLQTALLPMLPPWLGNPDLLFILVVYLGCKMDIVRGALLVFLFGLMLETFSGFFLGLYPITFLAIFLIIQGLSRFTTLNEGLYQPPLAATTYLLASAAIFSTTSLLAEGSEFNWSWGVIMLHFLLVSILTLPCFAAYDYARTLFLKKPTFQFFSKKKTNRYKSNL